MAWNKPSPENQRPIKKIAAKAPSAKRGIIAGAVVVVLSLAGLWFFFSGSGGLTERTNRQRVPSRDGGTDRPRKPTSATSVKDVTQASRSGDGERIPAAGAGNVDSEKMKAAQAGAADAGKDEKPKSKPVFEHSTDQLIAMAMTSAQGGASMPPLPGIGARDNAEFVKSLKKPIVINDDDSENVKAVKQLVQQTREEIVQLMEENPNMSFSDILQEHRKIHNENVDIKAQTTRELQKIIDEGDIEGAKKFRTTMNFALQQMGISEITTPITEEEKAEAEAAEEIDN